MRKKQRYSSLSLSHVRLIKDYLTKLDQGTQGEAIAALFDCPARNRERSRRCGEIIACSDLPDVLAEGAVVGRIFKGHAAPVGIPHCVSRSISDFQLYALAKPPLHILSKPN